MPSNKDNQTPKTSMTDKSSSKEKEEKKDTQKKYISDSDSSGDSECEEVEIMRNQNNDASFASLLHQLFPSNHTKLALEKFNNYEDSDSSSNGEDDEDEEEEEDKEKSDKKSNKKEKVSDSDSDSDYDPEEDPDYYDDEEMMYEYGRNGLMNIMGGAMGGMGGMGNGQYDLVLTIDGNAKKNLLSQFMEEPEYSESDEGGDDYESNYDDDLPYSETEEEEEKEEDKKVTKRNKKVKRKVFDTLKNKDDKNKKKNNGNAKKSTRKVKKTKKPVEEETEEDWERIIQQVEREVYRDEKERRREGVSMNIKEKSNKSKKPSRSKKTPAKTSKVSSPKNKGSSPKKTKTKLLEGDRVSVELPSWDKAYRGIILRLRKKRNSIKYDIRLDDDELEIVRNVERKYINPTKDVDDKLDDCLESLYKSIKEKGGHDAEGMLDTISDLSKKHQERKKKEAKKENEKKTKSKNMKKLHKMLRDKNVMNDFNYFKKLGVEEQNNIIEKLTEVNNFHDQKKPYRIQLIESNIPTKFKSMAMKKLNSLSYIEPGSGEYYRLKQWVDTFMRLPFNKYSNLPVSIEDGPEKCKEFMTNAKKTLDEAVYGLDDAKIQIMQMIGQWISNPESLGTAIAIKGPMGTGKTTLVKEGISKILNRPFAFIALGGATDSSFLEGHSYTYEGSLWGKIVDILLQSKCMNPVIYFDELDKISDTPKGEEIVGILTHLTDTTQNDQFHDKYFSNIHFNLSKAMFIFSYNDERKVNPILRDRMYRIETKGYDKKQKTIISNQYLIPKIIKSVNFKKDEIIIPDETIEYLAENVTDKEKGVRNLKRALEIIHTKINLYRLMDGDESLFGKEQTMKIEFPFTVTKNIVDKLIKKKPNETPLNMYI